MSIAKLNKIVKAFGGGVADATEQKQLVKELMLMTLARATRSDANVDGIEVEAVRSLLCETLGEEVSAADVRVAAMSALYETAPLKKYLSRVGQQISVADRQTILRALAQVIDVDGHVRPQEVTFFNMVAQALKLGPADIASLKAS